MLPGADDVVNALVALIHRISIEEAILLDVQRIIFPVGLVIKIANGIIHYIMWAKTGCGFRTSRQPERHTHARVDVCRKFVGMTHPARLHTDVLHRIILIEILTLRSFSGAVGIAKRQETQQRNDNGYDQKISQNASMQC